MPDLRPILCPKCGKRRLTYDPDARLGRCFGCVGHPGYNHITIKRLLGYEPTKNVALHPKDNPPPAVAYFVDQYTLTSLQSAYARDPVARMCIDDRNLPLELLDSMGVKWRGDTNKLYFPIHTVGQPPTGKSFHTRSAFKEQKGWRRAGDHCPSAVWTMEARFPWLRNIWVLVEGIWDAIAIWQAMGWSVMALLGTSLDTEQLCWAMRQPKEVRVWFDPDEAGIDGSRKVIKSLGCISFPPRRCIYQKEPADCTPDEISGVFHALELWSRV